MKFYRRLAPFQALTFDLDDTLYDNRVVIMRAERALKKWLLDHCPAMEAFDTAAWQKMRQDVLDAKPDLFGFITEIRAAVLRLAATRCGLSEQAAAALSADAVAFFLHHRSDITVPEAARELIIDISQHYPLVAMTNGNVDTDRLGLNPYFSAIYRAGEHGAPKPAADLFARAQSALECSYGEILHVGDHLKADIRGAKRLGMQTCWLNESGQSLRHQRHATMLPDVEISTLGQLRTLLPEL
ncbi:5-amino-6-(5-phospho-D-ribitylamino)uracil phosphatase YigB [Veronia pacifica]|uniref:2-haloalkanoic acid dehalogenase n=1 Tax=Veronia pacifica TaxID=1080227 RepID=A0A1C3EJL0_9GAMM|nr:5-amino-6-(5-phospho-D-ribitylamino)uracil phosphatase YigB [Veronia pacifica]ODA33426.1 2-haloalkanoic acid dehalogenase [Veronia pacifica]